jgi:hypothetical protein
VSSHACRMHHGALGWLVGWPDEICILRCIDLYLHYKEPLIPNVNVLTDFPLFPRSHNPPMSQTNWIQKDTKKNIKKNP